MVPVHPSPSQYDPKTSWCHLGQLRCTTRTPMAIPVHPSLHPSSSQFIPVTHTGVLVWFQFIPVHPSPSQSIPVRPSRPHISSRCPPSAASPPCSPPPPSSAAWRCCLHTSKDQYGPVTHRSGYWLANRTQGENPIRPTQLPMSPRGSQMLHNHSYGHPSSSQSIPVHPSNPYWFPSMVPVHPSPSQYDPKTSQPHLEVLRCSTMTPMPIPAHPSPSQSTPVHPSSPYWCPNMAPLPPSMS